MGAETDVLSKLTISWFSHLLKKGWRKPLETGDLIPLPQSLTCEVAYHAFLRGLSALPEPPPPQPPTTTTTTTASDKGTSKRSAASGDGICGKAGACGGAHHPPSPEQHLHDLRAMLRLIWRLHGPALRRALGLIYAYQICVFFQPVLLRELTNQLAQGKGGDGRIWLLPAALFLSPVLGSVFKAQAQLTMIRIQIGLRSQLTAAVYRKCLRLSAGARAELPSGKCRGSRARTGVWAHA
ncbi:hypothetical protein GPECTOR_17g972 [Gonium pectorale]|uniref:ABC transmembrane type-1 domain-containing protein n=1 Tax=Gonium pectorale TaxID=33097 RepID=A0A150GKK6_GONPE|nr:hypothetical protein GPECTOR_17g972 [Gonium pectorale]|eukprot:KXZ50331.1 hypothetical protein GPECTOR_17g972 [Gonium pectorale]